MPGVGGACHMPRVQQIVLTHQAEAHKEGSPACGRDKEAVLFPRANPSASLPLPTFFSFFFWSSEDLNT